MLRLLKDPSSSLLAFTDVLVYSLKSPSDVPNSKCLEQPIFYTVSQCFLNNYLSVMKWTTSLTYCLIVVKFVPAIIVLMYYLKRAFLDVYEQMKCKILLASLVYLFLISFRLVGYLAINWRIEQIKQRN